MLPLFLFAKCVWERVIFLKHLGEFNNEVIRDWSFPSGKVLFKGSIYLINTGLLFSILVSVLVNLIFQEAYFTKFNGINLFLIFFYNLKFYFLILTICIYSFFDTACWGVIILLIFCFIDFSLFYISILLSFPVIFIISLFIFFY